MSAPRKAPLAADADLPPCPFCGQSDTVSELSASELEGADWTGAQDDAHIVVCNASSPARRGCGASSGFRPTKAEARASWIARAPATAPEADQLAHELAERLAVSDIECHCLPLGRALSGGSRRYDTRFTSEDEADEVAAAVRYLDMRGLLIHDAAEPAIVSFKRLPQ